MDQSAQPTLRILVVGGVAAGMSFAARARRLDESAEIVVFERGQHPSFANCGLPYYVSGEIEQRDALLVQTPQSLRDALDIDVRVGHDVVAVDAGARTITVRSAAGESVEHYDRLMLAPGAASLMPEIAGVDAPQVSLLRTVEDAVALRERAGTGPVVVVGGGYIGLEAAEAFRLRGDEVHVIQRGPHVLSRLEPELASLVTGELQRGGVSVHSGVTVVAIEDQGDQADVVLSDGARLSARTVLVAAGTRPDTDFLDGAVPLTPAGFIAVDAHGATSVPGIWAAGDATSVADPLTGGDLVAALAGPANRNGRLIADAMLGGSGARPQPTPLQTSIVRVFGQAVAMTGRTRAELQAAGIEHHTLHLHAGSHAGYFPGSEPVHLVVHFAAGDHRIAAGTLLGAQAVGRDGIDKRIDVLATAIRAGLHVSDLIDLDLAYAPPYGSAKDPITMAGLVGDNVLTGTTVLWYPWELDAARQATLILDVRRADERARGFLAGSLHVPHTELRDRIDEVREAAGGRPVRIHCASGVRSYLAHRQLVAAGFDSATLSGGMQTLLAFHGKGILSHEEH
ncbi:FAD-dependent oxidoreductase [Microbacterium sp. GXS0129]|uniref:FAD-dependent oxidoreductase n=1 Tax=Microbacterium sp. GXS0129 TaxID=3377836 RepID=UPI00383B7DB5